MSIAYHKKMMRRREQDRIRNSSYEERKENMNWTDEPIIVPANTWDDLIEEGDGG